MNSITDIYDARADLAREEQQMEREALYTLQHHAFRHSRRLLAVVLGWKIPTPEIEPDDIEEEAREACNGLTQNGEGRRQLRSLPLWRMAQGH